jgi:hypothetical protein
MAEGSLEALQDCPDMLHLGEEFIVGEMGVGGYVVVLDCLRGCHVVLLFWAINAARVIPKSLTLTIGIV